MLAVCLLLPFCASAQNGRVAELRLGEMADGRIEVLFTLGDAAIDSCADGYAALRAEGMVAVSDAGEGWPALPRLSRLLALPRGTRLTIDNATPTKTHPMLTLATPVSADGTPMLLRPYMANVKDADPGRAAADKKAYGSEAAIAGGPSIELRHLGTMGDREVYRIDANPAQYHPHSGHVAIAESIGATLTVSHSPLSTPHSPLSPPRYLIVAPPPFAEGLQPFVGWKRQEGYDVELIAVGVNHPDSVRAQIGERWGDTGPEYILLVGDTAQLRPFTGTSRPAGLPTHVTDLYFAEHTGDYLPDALIGRWPVRDTAELSALVRKTVAYERGEGLDTAALRRVLLVAGAENSAPAPTTTNGQVNYLKREIPLVHPEVDTLCYYNPSSDSLGRQILADAADGVALISYTAHCSATKWSHPAIGFAQFDSAGLDQPTLFVNNCCLSNDFADDCLGEQLLRMPSGGAIGVIGATNSTLWDEDYYWAVGPKYPFELDPQYDPLRPGAFDRWVGRSGGAETQGQLLAAGNMAVSAFGSPYDRFYWETYCLLGDPSLRPFMGNVEQAWIAPDSTIVAGMPSIGLHATPGATVTAVAQERLLGSAVTDSTGHATIVLNQCIDTGLVTLTATGAGLLPQSIDATAAVPQHGVALVGVTVDDSAIAFTLANVGTDTLIALSIAYYNDTACAGCTQIMAPNLTADTLAPAARTAMRLPYSVAAIGQSPWWSGNITVSDNTTLGNLHLQHLLALSYPVLHIDLLNADSSAADSVQLGGHYIVSATVSGTYDTLSVSTEEINDSVGHLHITAEVGLGGWSATEEWYIVCGQPVEGFEQGLGCYPWQTGGTMGWQQDTVRVHSGRYSLRSGPIGHRQTSDLVLDLVLPHADTISYWYYASSEAQADRMLFSIDGVTLADHWGVGHWRKDEFVVGSGRHTLRWRYLKDASVSQWDDCVWIDDLRLPLALWDAPYGCPPQEPGSTPGDSTGIPQLSTLNPQISIYPNPSSGKVYIGAEGPTVVGIEVRDLFGRIVATADAQTAAIDVSPLPAGVYIAVCRLADGQTVRQRLMVNKQ